MTNLPSDPAPAMEPAVEAIMDLGTAAGKRIPAFKDALNEVAQKHFEDPEQVFIDAMILTINEKVPTVVAQQLADLRAQLAAAQAQIEKLEAHVARLREALERRKDLHFSSCVMRRDNTCECFDDLDAALASTPDAAMAEAIDNARKEGIQEALGSDFAAVWRNYVECPLTELTLDAAEKVRIPLIAAVMDGDWFKQAIARAMVDASSSAMAELLALRKVAEAADVVTEYFLRGGKPEPVNDLYGLMANLDAARAELDKAKGK